MKQNLNVKKHVQNMAPYNPHNLSDVHDLEYWMSELTLVMHSIATMDLVTCYWWICSGSSVLYHFVILESNITM